jgi:hypothetical protein
MGGEVRVVRGGEGDEGDILCGVHERCCAPRCALGANK